MTILSVYFSGTGFSIQSISYIAGLLYLSSTDEHKMGFDGCGITDGLMGTLFGTGLEEQCDEVVNKIYDLLVSTDRVVVNCYGHSRGGIAALMLAKRLGGYAKDLVEVNLALLDPVPGNLIASANMDFFNVTLANQVIDLSECHNLGRVLALYPYEPLPDLAFHAPIIPTYPDQSQVEEETILGCHAEAEMGGSGLPNELARTRIIEFMKACGSSFEFSRYTNGYPLEESTLDGSYLDLLERSKQYAIDSERFCHSKRCEKIVLKKPDNSEAWYLNDYHKKLKEKQDDLFIELPIFEEKHREIDGNLLLNLSQKIKASLSESSKASRKGKILGDYISELASIPFIDEGELPRTLRNIIALCLQRDRYAYSLFTTTKSGEFLRDLLAKKEYQPIAALILGSRGGQPSYKDLRSFVLGQNNESYFNAANKDRNLDILEDQSITTNHMTGFIM